MRAAALAALALLPPAAFAQEFTAPEGCVLDMTVQLASCRVTQHYHCAGDPPGDQWMAVIDASGAVVHLARTDAETRWIETRDPRTGHSDRLAEEADPASLRALLETGRDDYDFHTEAGDGLRLRYRGFDRLTGEAVTIDGVELLVTEFSLTATLPDGSFVLGRRGGQFVSAAQGRFFGGREDWRDWTGAAGQVDDSPRAFAAPGQPGFASLRPRFGCGLEVAGLSRR